MTRKHVINPMIKTPINLDASNSHNVRLPDKNNLLATLSDVFFVKHRKIANRQYSFKLKTAIIRRCIALDYSK